MLHQQKTHFCLPTKVRFCEKNKLAELSMEFSVDIINLVKYLKSNHESIISNQISRSGTGIGANIHEAQYAQGKKDFISKLEIPLISFCHDGGNVLNRHYFLFHNAFRDNFLHLILFQSSHEKYYVHAIFHGLHLLFYENLYQ